MKKFIYQVRLTAPRRETIEVKALGIGDAEQAVLARIPDAYIQSIVMVRVNKY